MRIFAILFALLLVGCPAPDRSTIQQAVDAGTLSWCEAQAVGAANVRAQNECPAMDVAWDACPASDDIEEQLNDALEACHGDS